MILKSSLLAQVLNTDVGQPFVFAGSGLPKALEPLPESTILAVPFERLTIEESGDRFITVDPDSKRGANTIAISANELAPGNYEFALLCEQGGKLSVIGATKDYKPDIYQWALSFVESYLEKIHANKAGTISVSDRVKLKKDRRKQKKASFYKPGHAIYIDTSSAKTRATSYQGKAINWSHSWLVRGHWRKLNNVESLGLDRQGQRVVKGYTWVASYKKGDKELLTKVRRVQ